MGEWTAPVHSLLQSRLADLIGSHVIVATSGGLDSMVLLHLVRFHLADIWKATISVAHIDHGLRSASGEDARFVRRTAASYGVAFHQKKLRPELRLPPESIEMWGRRERYTFLQELKAAHSRAFILTAHHQDDQVETVMMRLARGTGIEGLVGIHPQRADGVLRPLLDIPRCELVRYAHAHGIAYREDESNRDMSYLRNWVRLRLLPDWETRESGLRASVCRIARLARELSPGIPALMREVGGWVCDAQGQHYLPLESVGKVLSTGQMGTLREWLRMAPALQDPPLTMFSERILRELKRQWSHTKRGLRLDIAPGLTLLQRKNGLYLEKRSTRSPPSARNFPSVELTLDQGGGEVSWSWEDKAYALKVKRFPSPGAIRFFGRGKFGAIFDAACFSSKLIIRTRMNGDRFSPLGVPSVGRKLKAFLSDRKVPIVERDALPLIQADERICWVPGHGVSHHFRVKPDTKTLMEMVLECRTT